MEYLLLILQATFRVFSGYPEFSGYSGFTTSHYRPSAFPNSCWSYYKNIHRVVMSCSASKLYDIKMLWTILSCPLPLCWPAELFSFLFSAFVLYFVYYFTDHLGDFPWETRAAFLSLAHPNPSRQWEPSLVLFKQADFCGDQQKRRRNYCV